MSKNIENLKKLIQFAVERTIEGNDTFVKYAGHTNGVYYKACVGKWHEYVFTKVDEYCDLERLTNKRLKSWIEQSKVQALASTS